MRCPKCGWEGPREETKQEESGLMFYDRLAKDQFKVDFIRMNYRCPRCGEMIETRRIIPGMDADSTPQ